MWTINWWLWRRKPAEGAESVALEEAEENRRRRLALERTYQTVQAHERDIRAAAERVQAELDVLRRER